MEYRGAIYVRDASHANSGTASAACRPAPVGGACPRRRPVGPAVWVDWDPSLSRGARGRDRHRRKTVLDTFRGVGVPVSSFLEGQWRKRCLCSGRRACIDLRPTLWTASIFSNSAQHRSLTNGYKGTGKQPHVQWQHRSDPGRKHGCSQPTVPILQHFRHGATHPYTQPQRSLQHFGGHAGLHGTRK